MGIFRRSKEQKPINPKIAIGFFVIFLGVFAYLKWQQLRPLHADVWVGNTYVYADVADTNEKRAQGLAGRRVLKNGEGMYFTFPGRQQYAFWMKGMSIPIDIIWIDGRTIVDMAPEVPPPPAPDTPPEQLKSYIPRVPATAVLEVPAGFALANQWKIGDTITVQFDR